MAIRVTGNIVISDTQAISNVTTINASGNANVLNLGTAQVLATANVTAPQLISNIATGTAPFLVTSTTKVTNLNADTLDGYDTATAATASTVVVRDTNGNITGNFFIGNGSQLTGISASFPLANGTSNIDAPAVNGNINISVGGTANVLITTSTGVNVTGTLNSSGNANTLNLGTARVIATGNISGTQLISNIATGTAPLVVTSTTKVANLNAETLDGFFEAVAATASTVVVRDANGNIAGNFFTGNGSQLTGISASFPLANGTSNINAPAADGNINISVGGTANVLITTSTGVNVTGTLNSSGNANTLNLGTARVLATGNVTAPQLISNVATGTAPLVVTSTTVVANLNANALQGNTPAQTATANTIVQRNADGNITGNFFIGNGSQLTGISAGFPLANGTSNINAPTSGGNINISVGGTANVLITTSTGVNVTGTLNATGNANTGNLGTTTAVITTANITTINSTLLQQGSANITLVNNGNIRFNPGGSADEVVFTSTGANVNGYLTVTGNITGGIISNSTNVFSTAASNYAIGYRQMPQNSQSGATYTLVLDDEGKSIYLTGTTICTVTVPANASQAFPIGSVLTMINNNSGNLSINSSATLQLANGTAGNRTVLTKGMATCIKTASDTWYVIGLGVS